MQSSSQVTSTRRHAQWTYVLALTLSRPTPRQNECAGLSHARIVSTREGLVPIKFAIETTARQNGGNLNSLCLFSFCDDKDNTTLIRFKF